ncbi:MAG: yceI 1 [Rickettsiaceae bacterium]|jgi:polyisoprenoid-binding protein YceI|nr:yceI 1 [Rickettsiaceae bacterium]
MKTTFTKALIVSSLLLSFPLATQAADYTFDPSHTNILWHTSHFGFSSPSGRFGIKSGNINLDETTPKNSSVNVVIDTNDLVTGITKFDDHIKSPDFLDVKKFPTATFKSTSVEPTGDKTADVRGDFTLHGVTKPIVLKVTLNKIGEHPMTHNKTVGFTASTTIKRSEFGIAKYVPDVGDDVQIDIESEASVQAPAKK